MRGERGRRAEEKHVVVVRADECVDGDEAVAAGAVLDHHRLAPFRGELFGDQPRADVGAGARTKRQQELDGARRPVLRRRGQGRQRKRRHREERAGQRFCDAHEFLRVGAMPSIRCGLDAEQLTGGGDLGALRVDRRAEFGGPAGIDHLSGGKKPRGDRGIGSGGFHVVGDALAQLRRHVARPEQAGQALDPDIGIAGLGGGRNVGRDRGALARRHRDHPDRPACTRGRTIAMRRHHDLDAALGEIVHRLHRVAIRHLGNVDAHLLLEAGEHEIEHAGDGRPVQLAGIGARRLDQFLHRLDVGRGRHHHGDDSVGDARDRGEVARS